MFISVLENFSSVSRVIFSSPEVEVQPDINIFNNSFVNNNNSFINNNSNSNNNKINIPSIEIIDTDEIPIPDSKKNSETLKSVCIDFPVPCTSFESHFFQLFCQPETISNVQNPQTILHVKNVSNPQNLSNKDSQSTLVENQSKLEINRNVTQNVSSEDFVSKSEINRTEPQKDSNENAQKNSSESQNLSKSQIQLKTEVYFETLKKAEESEFDDFEELIFAPDLSKVLNDNQISVKDQDLFIAPAQSRNQGSAEDQNANDSETLKQNVENNYGLGFNQNSLENVVRPETIHQTFGDEKDFRAKSESFEFEEVIYADDYNIGDSKEMINSSSIIADDKTSTQMINQSNIESNFTNAPSNIESSLINKSSNIGSNLMNEHSNGDQDSSQQIGNKNIDNIDINNVSITNVNIENTSRNISNDSNQNGEKNSQYPAKQHHLNSMKC
jgi:hypothetical protein